MLELFAVRGDSSVPKRDLCSATISCVGGAGDKTAETHLGSSGSSTIF